MVTLISTTSLLILSPIASAQPRPGPQQPQGVIAVVAKKEAIADRIEALGTLAANESVTLTANITETVTSIYFEDGQVVEQGTVLVDLRDVEERALLQEVTSRAAEAKRQYERIEPLQKGGAAPTALIDERLREYETARAQVALLEARLQNRKIVAPFAGVLGLRNISVGALVTPGHPVVTLDDISSVKLDFSIPSVFLQGVKVGQRIVARTKAFPDREFTGSVASISNRVDPATRAVTVRAILPNPEGVLRPGLLMTVDLLKNERESLVLPEEAIIAEGDRKYVFVVNVEQSPNQVVKREVVTGAREPGRVEIISGIALGEQVVAHGTVKVRPGGLVKIVGTLEGSQGTSEEIAAILAAKAGESR